MNTWKRGLGIGLIFVGLFIVLTGKAITGAVIGFGAENYLSLLGILVFIVGVFLLFLTKESVVSQLSLEDIVDGIMGKEIINQGEYNFYTYFGEEWRASDPLLILDASSVIDLAGREEEGILGNSNLEIYLLGHVKKELDGLTRTKQTKRRTQKADRRIMNYIYSLCDPKKCPNFHEVEDSRLTKDQENHLGRWWNQYTLTSEGQRTTQGKNFERGLSEVADGKIAIYAYEQARAGKNIFVFTEDGALKGIIGEINKELHGDGYPLIIAGGMNDYEKYSHRETVAA